MPQVPIAVDECGRIAFAPTTTQTCFTCVECQDRLVLRRGAVRVPHFAHFQSTQCGGESILHKACKEWFAHVVHQATVHAACVKCMSRYCVWKGSTDSNATVEATIDSYRVDVKVTPNVCIEVKHTHETEEEKRVKLQSLGYQVYEIGAVSPYDTAYSTEFDMIAPHGYCESCISTRVITKWREEIRKIHFRAIDAHTRDRLTHIDTLPLRSIVDAPAGGGKTTLLFSIAKANPTKSFLLLTFSRSLLEELERKRPDNLDAHTFDSFCYSVAQVPGNRSLTDKALVEAGYPSCRPWFKKKGSRGIHTLAQAKVLGASVSLCDYHNQCKRAVYRAHTLPSFASNRAQALQSDHIIGEEYDFVLVDEYQDLSWDALMILARCKSQMLLVGDANQRIFTFNAEKCHECKIVSPMPAFLDTCYRFRLHTTFRNGPSTIAYTSSYGSDTTVPRKCTDKVFSISYSSIPLVLTKGTAVLVRSNAEVIKMLEYLLKTTSLSIGIAGGECIAEKVGQLFNMKHGRILSPMHHWVRHMSDTECTRIQQLLLQHDAPACSESRVLISTIHRAKGTEHKHVVAPVCNMDESRLYYVAHTRHRQCLFVFHASTHGSKRARIS